MRLGVNGIRLVTIRSGVARYIENMLRVWSECESPFETITVYTPSELDPTVRLGAGVGNVVVRAGPYGLWEQFHLPRAARVDDVLFCPSYVAPLWSRCPRVLVNHGSYESYPAAFDSAAHRWKAYLAYRASAVRSELVITVSEWSRRNILRYYRIPEDKVHVVPEGVDTQLFRPIGDRGRLAGFRREVLGADAPFLLYVGKPIRRHNIASMFEAYSRLVECGRTDCRFLFIGADLPGVDVRRLVRDLGIEDRVVIVGHADHEQVYEAMCAAEALIYASDCEGFGMPVLEAMACGTPAIALANSALPEFAGGVAYLAERGDVACLYAAIDTVLHDEDLRESMRQEGPVRAQAYDWRALAPKVLELLAGVV